MRTAYEKHLRIVLQPGFDAGPLFREPVDLIANGKTEQVFEGILQFISALTVERPPLFRGTMKFHFFELSIHPSSQQITFGIRRLRFILGRHFPAVE